MNVDTATRDELISYLEGWGLLDARQDAHPFPDHALRHAVILFQRKQAEALASRATPFPAQTEHACSYSRTHSGYGPAIDDISEHEDGTLWAGNGEYGTQINFCPFCGYKAKVQVSS